MEIVAIPVEFFVSPSLSIYPFPRKCVVQRRLHHSFSRIGEFIRIPHLAKIYWLSGGSVCYGKDSHKIKKFERNGEFERALAEDGVGI